MDLRFGLHGLSPVARSGQLAGDLGLGLGNGGVSFHGGLDSPTPADGKNIKCKVLALAGADDLFQNPNDLAAFEKEMRVPITKTRRCAT